MKLPLLVVVCFAAALAAPADKKKRDILPGDPRYGTDHHHHHHQQHENEVQVSRAIGGYVGSYSVPEVHTGTFQVPNPTYGPPSYQPGKPIGTDYFTTIDSVKNPVHVPSTSYGIPETTQIINNNYLTPVVEDKKVSIHTVPVPNVKTPLHAHHVNTDYQAPSVEAPVASYGLPVVADVRSEEHVHVPHTSYGTPVVKTTIEPIHVQNTVIPDIHVRQPVVHKHVETIDTVAIPDEVKVAPHLPAIQEVQPAAKLIPAPVNNLALPSVHTNYPVYTGSYQFGISPSIPVRTVDHRVQVQVPQPYPVPVTKHVTYPVPVPQPVEVPRPYYVRVPQPVQITVDRPYPVEVPRPYYIRTSVPVQHHVGVAKANPVQTFFENTASTFQDVISNLPSFPNPLENFQNPLENFQNPLAGFQLPSFPSLPSLPSAPTVPSLPALPALPALPSFATQPTQSPAPVEHVDVSGPASNGDSVTVDNPTLKTAAPIATKTVAPIATKTFQHTQAVKTKEYVQPTDANGGYIY